MQNLDYEAIRRQRQRQRGWLVRAFAWLDGAADRVEHWLDNTRLGMVVSGLLLFVGFFALCVLSALFE